LEENITILIPAMLVNLRKKSRFQPLKEHIYLLKQVIFSGSCNGLTNVKIQGTMKAPSDPYFAIDKWIKIFGM